MKLLTLYMQKEKKKFSSKPFRIQIRLCWKIYSKHCYRPYCYLDDMAYFILFNAVEYFWTSFKLVDASYCHVPRFADQVFWAWNYQIYEIIFQETWYIFSECYRDELRMWNITFEFVLHHGDWCGRDVIGEYFIYF